MKGNLKHAIELTFGHEGGYVNNPKDPGGPTKFGITLGTLSAFRGHACTASDVATLTLDEAAQILEKGYWRKVWGDDLPSGVDFCMFDYAVNSGPAQAIKSVQRVLGVNRDGSLGPKTLAAIRAMSPPVLVRALCDDRLAFMKGLTTWSTFGKGWAKRVSRVREAALDMTSVAPEAVVKATLPATTGAAGAASAKPTETAVASTKQGKANLGTIVGSVVAGAGTVATTLAPYAETSWVKSALPVLALIGVVGTLIAGVVGWKIQANHIAGGSPQ